MAKQMIKTVPDNHPDAIALKAAEARLVDLQRQKRAKEIEIEQQTARYSEFASTNGDERLKAEADALLAGQPLMATTRDDIDRGNREIEILKAAIDRQSASIVQSARAKVAQVLQNINRSEYIRIQKRIAAALKELASANEEEIEFFSQLHDAAGGASIAFRPMRVTAVGAVSDPQSKYSFHMKELKEFVPEAVN
jgi:hypothetical protein